MPCSVDRSEKAKDLLGRRRPGIRLVPAPLGRCSSDLGEVLLRHAEVAQALEAAEQRKLAGLLDRVAADRVTEPLDRLRHEGAVELERGRKTERVHRSVRDAVRPTEGLRHRVAARGCPGCAAPSSSSLRWSLVLSTFGSAREMSRAPASACSSPSGVWPLTY